MTADPLKLKVLLVFRNPKEPTLLNDTKVSAVQTPLSRALRSIKGQQMAGGMLGVEVQHRVCSQGCSGETSSTKPGIRVNGERNCSSEFGNLQINYSANN